MKAKHDMEITDLGNEGRFKYRINCKDCNFQAHLYESEDPQSAVDLHKRRYGVVPSVEPMHPKVAASQMEPPKPTTPVASPVKLAVKK